MKRVLDKMGVRRELEGGGWFNLFPQAGNLAFGEKLRKLCAEARQELGLPIDADLINALGLMGYSALHARAMVGTVAMAWGDFERPDGSALPCFREDGSLDEAAGVEIILWPGVGDALGKAIMSLDDAAARDLKAAEKNSAGLFGGTSTTESS